MRETFNRPNAYVPKIQFPSETMYFCDAGLGSMDYDAAYFTIGPNSATMWDALQKQNGEYGRESLDYVPALHQNRMNILYVDGHAATVYVYPFTFSSPGTVDWATTKAHHPTDLTTVYIRKIK